MPEQITMEIVERLVRVVAAAEPPTCVQNPLAKD